MTFYLGYSQQLAERAMKEKQPLTFEFLKANVGIPPVGNYCVAIMPDGQLVPYTQMSKDSMETYVTDMKLFATHRDKPEILVNLVGVDKDVAQKHGYEGQSKKQILSQINWDSFKDAPVVQPKTKAAMRGPGQQAK